MGVLAGAAVAVGVSAVVWVTGGLVARPQADLGLFIPKAVNALTESAKSEAVYHAFSQSVQGVEGTHRFLPLSIQSTDKNRHF
jgi:carbohydrate-binding DOMON domain-containing protein